MFNRLLLCLLACTFGIGAAHAESVSWSNEYEIRTYESGAFDILYEHGNKLLRYDLTVEPYKTLDNHIWYFPGNPDGSQSPENIESLIRQQFGVGDLALVSQCDKTTSGCTGATASAGTSGDKAVNTFTSDNPFQYLAVHFGRGELLFAWANPGVTSVTITGIPEASLSNFRAYATPLPAAGLLFASALALGGFLRRGGSRQRKIA